MVARGSHHDHHHHDEGFWRKYIFSVDHKVIGIQYGITSLFFLLVGFCFMLVMRYQMAWPEKGIITPDEYNMLGAMHGTIMVFLGVVPLAVGAFGNYIVPVQIGAPDMAFPRLNMASYWVFLPGCIVMMLGFLTPGGAAQSGWTSYTPLSVLAGFGKFWDGQTMWLLGMVFLITSSLLGAVNFIVTIFQLRAPGLTFMRLPFFVWAQLVTRREKDR